MMSRLYLPEFQAYRIAIPLDINDPSGWHDSAESHPIAENKTAASPGYVEESESFLAHLRSLNFRKQP